MMDHPIIFSAPMVRALLDGRKTQTRRHAITQLKKADMWGCDWRPSPWQKVKPSDRLWVRESGLMHSGSGNFWYFATRHARIGNGTIWAPPDIAHDEMMKARNGQSANSNGWKIAPSIHMPRWASRLTLVVNDVRFERLQDISEEGCRWVGCDLGQNFYSAFSPPAGVSVSVFKPTGAPTAREAFKRLWISLHGADSWDKSPELVVIGFQVHQVNIDQMPAAGEVAA